MRYLCLVYGTEDSLPVMQNPNPTSRAEVDALTQDSLAYNDVLPMNAQQAMSASGCIPRKRIAS